MRRPPPRAAASSPSSMGDALRVAQMSDRGTRQTTGRPRSAPREARTRIGRPGVDGLGGRPCFEGVVTAAVTAMVPPMSSAAAATSRAAGTCSPRRRRCRAGSPRVEEFGSCEPHGIGRRGRGLAAGRVRGSPSDRARAVRPGLRLTLAQLATSRPVRIDSAQRSVVGGAVRSRRSVGDQSRLRGRRGTKFGSWLTCAGDGNHPRSGRSSHVPRSRRTRAPPAVRRTPLRRTGSRAARRLTPIVRSGLRHPRHSPPGGLDVPPRPRSGSGSSHLL